MQHRHNNLLSYYMPMMCSHRDGLSVVCPRIGSLFNFLIKLNKRNFVCLLGNPLLLVPKHSSRDTHNIPNA